MSPQAKKYLALERRLNVLTRQNPNDPERDDIAEQMDNLWDSFLSPAERTIINQFISALNKAEKTNSAI